MRGEGVRFEGESEGGGGERVRVYVATLWREHDTFALQVVLQLV